MGNILNVCFLCSLFIVCFAGKTRENFNDRLSKEFAEDTMKLLYESDQSAADTLSSHRDVAEDSIKLLYESDQSAVDALSSQKDEILFDIQFQKERLNTDTKTSAASQRAILNRTSSFEKKTISSLQKVKELASKTIGVWATSANNNLSESKLKGTIAANRKVEKKWNQIDTHIDESELIRLTPIYGPVVAVRAVSQRIGIKPAFCYADRSFVTSNGRNVSWHCTVLSTYFYAVCVFSHYYMFYGVQVAIQSVGTKTINFSLLNIPLLKKYLKEYIQHKDFARLSNPTSHGNEYEIVDEFVEEEESRIAEIAATMPIAKQEELRRQIKTSSHFPDHSVYAVSISPSGLYIAVLVRTCDVDFLSKSKDVKSTYIQGGNAQHELHVWSTTTNSHDHLEKGEDSIAEWYHLGAISIFTPLSNGTFADASVTSKCHDALIDWSFDDSLALLVPILKIASKTIVAETANTLSASEGALLSITSWKNHANKIHSAGSKLTSNEIEEHPPFTCRMHSSEYNSTPPVKVPGISLILPFATQASDLRFVPNWCGDGKCAVLVWSKSQIALYSITGAVSEKNVLPLWIEVRVMSIRYNWKLSHQCVCLCVCLFI